MAKKKRRSTKEPYGPNSKANWVTGTKIDFYEATSFTDRGKPMSSRQVNTTGYNPREKPPTKRFAAPKKTSPNDPYNNAGPKIRASSRGPVPTDPRFVFSKSKNGKEVLTNVGKTINRAANKAASSGLSPPGSAKYYSDIAKAADGMTRKNAVRASQVRAAAAVRKASKVSTAAKLPKVKGGKAGLALFAAGAGAMYAGQKMDEYKKKKKKDKK